MKVLFCAFLIFMSFSMAKGQCLDDTAFRTTSSCDGSMRSGSFVFVDLSKIGRPCTCTVNSLFVGDLLVRSWKVRASFMCNTRVIVNNTYLVNCNEVASISFKVGVNDILIVKAEHMSGNIIGSFNQCVGFSENGGRGGNLSVTCGTPADLTTTQFVFTTTISSTLESKSAMQSNIDVIALSASGGIVLLVSLIVFSFVMLRRNRQYKAKSPEVNSSLSYMVFDINDLPDNHVYATCQTVEEVELHVRSKQNQQIVLPQQTALNTIHIIDPDYDVLYNNKSIDQDESSLSLYEVPYTNCMKRDSSAMPLSTVPKVSMRSKKEK